MCDEIKITKVADDKIEVRTPYNPQFVSIFFAAPDVRLVKSLCHRPIYSRI